MIRKTIKLGAGLTLALALILPELTLPAAAFPPPPQTQAAPSGEAGFEEGIILADHRRGHRRYYGRRGGGRYYYGHRYPRYYGGSGIYLNFGLPYGYYGGYGGYGYGGYGYYDDYDDYGYYSGGYSSRHVRWCLNRYRSYNPRTDTFVGYDGHRHRCRSPY